MPEIIAQDMLREYKRMADVAREALENARLKSQKARRYYDGDQIDSKLSSTLRRRKQPETIRNRIGPAIDGILGILEQAKVDPRGYPRNPQDEGGADVCTKSLQYVAEQNRFHKTKIDCADNHLVEGACAAIVEVDDKGDVKINKIAFDEFFYDPYSREADYSDARYMGVGKWMYAADLARMYPDYREELLSTVTTSGAIQNMDMTWDDKPNSVIPWIDKKLKRLLVMEMYHQEGGEWKRCVFCAAGVLDERVSPYNDDNGTPMNPIEASSCFIDRELERYGVARRMIPLQDELNARASRSLHLFNTRQLQVTDPSYAPDVDAATARAEAAKADGLIPTGYSVVPTSDMASGNLALMQDVSMNLDRLAPTPAILGRQDGSNQSGRSRLVLQQAGMTEIARPLGRFEDWENRIYRQVWLRIKQFWTDQKFIRVTNDEGAPEFLQINEPIYQMEPKTDPYTGEPIVDPQNGEPEMVKVMVPQPVMGPDGQPQMGPDGLPVMQPQPVQIGIDNQVARMDMDIVVDTVPDTANLAAEQFETLAKLAQVYGPEAVPFEAMVELSSIPDKRKIKELLKPDEGAAAQAMQVQQQAQQQALQLAQADAQAKIAETESKTALNAAKVREVDAGIIKDAADMTGRALNGGGQPMPEPTF